MKDLVSVIVPVYNAEKYLVKCLESIVNQTYKNLEIILVNDGSKDNSLSICQEYAKRDARITVFDKTNGGVSSSRNFGIDLSSGEYVCFFDSDDYVEISFIEKLVNKIGDNDVCIGGYVAENYNEEGGLTTKEEVLLDIERIDDNFPLQNHKKLFALSMSLWNKLYRLSLIKENFLRFDEKVSFGEDGLFNADFFLLAKKFAF